MNNNLDKNLDPKLEKFIENVKAEFVEKFIKDK